MPMKRREFIKSIGIGFASLMLTQCKLVNNGILPTIPKTFSPRDRLRSNWLSLEFLASQTQQNFEQAEITMGDLIAEHRVALDKLVTMNELDVDVAELVQVAYAEATYHIWRSNAPITCYEPLMLDYIPTSRGQLMNQVSLLSEIADDQKIDESVIAMVQTALERDIAFLNFSDAETQSLYQELLDAAGESYDVPSFDELDLEISSAAVEAARLLAEILLAN